MRCEYLGIQSLETRRMVFDLCLVYKIFHDLIDINYNDMFQFSHNMRTRGHNYKLYKSHMRIENRKDFFACRVVDVWNNLPNDVVNSGTLHIFRTNLEKNKDKFIKFVNVFRF